MCCNSFSFVLLSFLSLFVYLLMMLLTSTAPIEGGLKKIQTNWASQQWKNKQKLDEPDPTWRSKTLGLRPTQKKHAISLARTVSSQVELKLFILSIWM